MIWGTHTTIGVAFFGQTLSDYVRNRGLLDAIFLTKPASSVTDFLGWVICTARKILHNL